MRAVLIEDIAASRDAIRNMLNDLAPDIKIVGESGSVLKAAKIIRKENPDLLFLDVELEDGSGFDLLEIIGDMNIPVIFTTGSEGYAVRAFRFAAMDYLLKPVDPDDLLGAIQKIGKSREQAQLEILKEHLYQPKSSNRIALHTQDKIILVNLDDIIRVEADGNYSKFYLQKGKPILVAKTLKAFDALLHSSGFIRVHQSHLVNLAFISEFIKTDGGYLVLTEGTKIPVSTRKRARIVGVLGKIS